MQTTAELHSDQIDYWNGAGGSRWVQRQAATDVMLAPFADLLLAESGLQAGDAVVDLGCGCGATTAAVAARVGETGRVLGLDVSAPMLAQARERLSAFPNATCVCADAACHAVETFARFERLQRPEQLRHMLTQPKVEAPLHHLERGARQMFVGEHAHDGFEHMRAGTDGADRLADGTHVTIPSDQDNKADAAAPTGGNGSSTNGNGRQRRRNSE